MYFIYLKKCESIDQEDIDFNIRQLVSNMKAEQEKQDIYNTDIDIYAERWFIGVVAGYPKEFMNREFVELMLTEMRPQGCWMSELSRKSSGQRKLFRSGNSDDECDYHTSAVVAGVLASYLKYNY